jgi:DNA-binding HxlR family transcriptional regulator
MIAGKVLGERWERVKYSLTIYGRTVVPVLTLKPKQGNKHRKSGRANSSAEAASLLQEVSQRNLRSATDVRLSCL